MENSATSKLDLSTEELATIAHRINRTLKLHNVLPAPSLQYRLCEVGRVRSDPRALKRALRELADNRRPRRGKVQAGPWEPLQHVWAYAELGRQESEEAAQGISSLMHNLEQVAPAVYFDDWIAEACGDLGDVRISNGEVSQNTRTIGAGCAIRATETHTEVRTALGNNIAVWLTHDIDWLYPDDPRLWRFLNLASEADARALIIARKIAPASFPVLKKLGAFGLQYYSFLGPESSAQEISRIARALGWIHVASPEELLRKPVAARVRDAVIELATVGPTESQKEVLSVGTEIGMAQAESDAASLLLRWGEHATVAMPDNWLTTARRWIEFEHYRRRGFTAPPITTFRITTSATLPSREGDQDGARTEPEPAEQHSDGASSDTRRGFGRETVVSRVPLRLRW